MKCLTRRGAWVIGAALVSAAAAVAFATACAGNAPAGATAGTTNAPAGAAAVRPGATAGAAAPPLSAAVSATSTPHGATASSAAGPPATSFRPWSFAIEADTQWSGVDDGKNPNSVAVDIVHQLDRQFIARRVKFVVEVGDLCDNGTIAGEATRAVFAQELYDAHIGFYPLVGNHDDGAADAGEFAALYPQTRTATMNRTPAAAFTVTDPDASGQPFPARSGTPFRVGTISAVPAAPRGYAGLDYAVDYRNARLVFLDQFATAGSPDHEALTSDDVDWMNRQLTSRPAGTQAFVFGHKGIITEQHTDTLFGSDPSADPSLQNAFVADLQRGDVRYYIGGHDHMYNRALVASPNFKWHVQDIISQSDASTYSTPRGAGGGAVATPPDPSQTNDDTYDIPAFGAAREKEIAQQAAPAIANGITATAHVGYFIVSVAGPRVTIAYYAAPVKATLSGFGYAISTTPTLSFTRQETFGYSLNGKEFFVPEGGSYRVVSDRFKGTTAEILGGTNAGTATDAAGRKLTKDVTTGWTKPARRYHLASNVLMLWGLADVGARTTDTFTLAMSTAGDRARGARLRALRALVSRNARGRWVDAVELNRGGGARFVRGPWRAGDTLGTYGFDPHSHTAWAVVDHTGEFALSRLTRP